MEASENRKLSSERPDGIAPLVIGWVSLVIAMILLLLSLGEGPTDSQLRLAAIDSSLGSTYAAEIAQAYARQFLLQVGAGAFFSLFLVFWSVGYIVRAMSFLPGRETSQ